MDRMTMWEQLVQGWYPDDKWQPTPAMREYYYTKFATIEQLQPKSICEIGVRAGYSAFAFLCAAPDAHFVGFDNCTPFEGGGTDATWPLAWAAKLLKRWDVTLLNVDSQQLTELPGLFDFVHVDGDHSFESCLHDIMVAFALPGRRSVLVDDYDTLPSVRAACDIVSGSTTLQSKVLYPPGNRPVPDDLTQYKSLPGVHSRYIQNLTGDMLLWRA